MSSFKDFHLRKELMNALNSIGFSSPTPIQKLVLPRAIKKESLMVQSATGSGKTHSFLVPILQNIDANKKEVQVVIISPTRELATQLYDVLITLVNTYEEPLNVVKVIGGGLAGSEAAYQLAKRGVKVKLYDMKPLEFSEAHKDKNI